MTDDELEIWRTVSNKIVLTPKLNKMLEDY